VESAKKAFTEARRLGLTTVHDMMGGESYLRAYEAVRAQGGMTARVYGRWPIADWKWLADRVRRQGVGDDMLVLRSLKGFADGSIGSSTALFFQPYSDDARNLGLPSDNWREIPGWAVQADAAGLQLSIHAIGDRANLRGARAVRAAGAHERRARPPAARGARPAHARARLRAPRPAGRGGLGAAVSRHRRRPVRGAPHRPPAQHEHLRLRRRSIPSSASTRR